MTDLVWAGFHVLPSQSGRSIAIERHGEGCANAPEDTRDQYREASTPSLVIDIPRPETEHHAGHRAFGEAEGKDGEDLGSHGSLTRTGFLLLDVLRLLTCGGAC